MLHLPPGFEKGKGWKHGSLWRLEELAPQIWRLVEAEQNGA